jgi:hypothetical protein
MSTFNEDYRYITTSYLYSYTNNYFNTTCKEYFENLKFGTISNNYIHNRVFHHEISFDIRKSEGTLRDFNFIMKSEFNYLIRSLYFGLIDNKIKNYNKNDIIDISPRKLKIKNLLSQTKETVDTNLNNEILKFLNSDNINGIFLGEKSQLSKSLDINHWDNKEENDLYNYLGSKNRINFFRVEHNYSYEMLLLLKRNFIDFYIEPYSFNSFEFDNYFKHNTHSPLVGGEQEEYFRFKMNLSIHYSDNVEIYKIIKYTNI